MRVFFTFSVRRNNYAPWHFPFYFFEGIELDGKNWTVFGG
jgi:hypothetical protein